MRARVRIDAGWTVAEAPNRSLDLEAEKLSFVTEAYVPDTPL